MPPFDPRARIERARGRRKHVLPRDHPVRIWVLPLQCVGQVNRAKTGGKILRMQLPDALHLALKRFKHRIRQHRDPVLAALALAHRQAAPLNVDILHPQAQTFEQPQPRPMQQHRHDPAHPVQARHDRAHFLPRENHGKSRRLLRAHDALHPAQLLPEHFLVQKQHRAQGLILRRRRHVARHRKMRQKRLDLQLAHFGGVPLAVEENKAPNPAGVCLLGADAVVPHPNRITHPLKQARLTRRRYNRLIGIGSKWHNRRTDSEHG